MNGRLPRYLDEFFGRQTEFALLHDALMCSQLVSVVGCGGVGKTRLVVEFCRQIQNQFTDGVYFLDAYSSRDLNSLIFHLGQLFEISDVRIEWIESTLIRHLCNKNALLVIDNTEHLDLAGLLMKLLEPAEQLKIMVTSRERLHLKGEFVCPLYPFELDSDEAIQLLHSRARRSGMDMQQLHPHLSRHICTLLEGLPLAIELVASRMYTHPVRQLLEQLQNNLLFQDDLQDPLECKDRQSSMRNVLDWSYQLLTNEQQLALRALGFFDAPLDRQEAVQVLQVVLDQHQVPLSAQSLLVSLIEKHLIYHKIGPEGQGKVFMLDMVRQYARNQYSPHEQEALAESYTRCFLAALQESHPHGHRSRMEFFACHQHTLHQLVQVMVQHDPFLCAELIARIWHFWQASRHYYLGLHHTDQLYHAYQNSGGNVKTPELGKHICTTLLGAAWISNDNFDYDGSQEYFLKVLHLARSIQHTVGVAQAHSGLAHLCMFWGDVKQAGHHIEQASQIIPLHGSLDQQEWMNSQRGRLLFHQGHYREAEKNFEQVQQYFLCQKNLWGCAWSQLHLAELYFETCQFERASRLLWAMWEGDLPLEDMPTVRLHLLLLMVRVLIAQQDLPTATKMLDTCMQQATDQNTSLKIHDVQLLRLQIALAGKNVSLATRLLEELRTNTTHTVTCFSILDTYYSAGLLEHLQGNPAQAKLHHQRCQSLHQQQGIVVSPRRHAQYNVLLHPNEVLT